MFFTQGSMDLPFFLMLCGILAFGLLMVFSASSFSAFYYENDSLKYLKSQALYAGLGMIALLIISKVDYKWFRLISIAAAVVALGLMIYVLVQPGEEGVSQEEIKRWIYIKIGGKRITFQPSEFAKYALILLMAYRLDADNKKLRDPGPCKITKFKPLRFIYLKSGKRIYISNENAMFFLYIALIGLVEFLLYKESHLSGMILILGIGLAMLWFGEGKRTWFIIGAVVGIIVVIYVLKNYESLGFLKEYWKDRLRAWFDKSYSPTDKRWQTNQSLYAIGSGGFFGAGLGNSKEKYLYVSEPQNDFIFAIICEELGFVGAVGVLAAFTALVLRGLYIANRAKDRFGTLLCYGIVTHLALQVILNVGVVSDLLPNTGIGLPFISSGGSALLINLAEMGTLLSVSRQANLPKVYTFGKIDLSKLKLNFKFKRRKKKKTARGRAAAAQSGKPQAM